jgi:polar amino acid transport system substrate-binding protein
MRCVRASCWLAGSRRAFCARVLALVVLCIFAPTDGPFAAQLASEVAAATPYAGDVPAVIKERGVFRAAFVRAVPWAFRNRHGDYVGFEIDVAKQLARDMNVEHRAFPTTFGSIIPALVARRFDAIVGSMAITPHRQVTAVFTEPYVPKAAFGESVVASRRITKSITDIDSLNRPDFIVASSRFSQAAKVALETFPAAEHRHFISHAQAIEAVLRGEAVAAVGPEPHPTLWSLENAEGLYMPFGEETLNGGLYAIAVRLDERDLLDYLNKWIVVRKEDGWLPERFRYWFRSTEWYDEMVSPPGRLQYSE